MVLLTSRCGIDGEAASEAPHGAATITERNMHILTALTASLLLASAMFVAVMLVSPPFSEASVTGAQPAALEFMGP